MQKCILYKSWMYLVFDKSSRLGIFPIWQFDNSMGLFALDAACDM